MNGIPKIIHQTWKDHNIPDKWKKSQQQWISLHPDWTYILWTDSDIRNHISTYHPEFLKLHDSYEYPIQRADMIRYFVLYDYGGVYCDLDLYPTKNIDDYIIGSFDHFVYEAGSNNSIVNAFMISPKGSPIMKEIQKKLKEVDIPWFCIGKHLKVMYSTGPNFLYNILLDTKYPYIILPRKLFYPYSSSEDKMINQTTKDIIISPIKNTSGSWHSIDSIIYAFINKHKPVFITLGILFILFVIIGLIYYIIKYKKCKELKDNCERTCNI